MTVVVLVYPRSSPRQAAAIGRQSASMTKGFQLDGLAAVEAGQFGAEGRGKRLRPDAAVEAAEGGRGSPQVMPTGPGNQAQNDPPEAA